MFGFGKTETPSDSNTNNNASSVDVEDEVVNNNNTNNYNNTGGVDGYDVAEDSIGSVHRWKIVGFSSGADSVRSPPFVVRASGAPATLWYIEAKKEGASATKDFLTLNLVSTRVLSWASFVIRRFAVKVTEKNTSLTSM